jgi:hypothetical protein
MRTLLQSCLVKDPRRRVADISIALFVLEKGASLAPPAAAVSAAPLPRRSLWQRLVIPVAAALVASVVVGAGVWFSTRPAPMTQASAALRFRLQGSPVEMFTLSADGRHLAFITNTGGPNQLWVRAMDALESRPLAGTDGATYPF